MKRPSIALSCIMKNEAENLPRLLKSVEGCFDHIYLTDTGSTDGSKDVAKKILKDHHERFGTKFTVLDFEWISDFAAARNHALGSIKEDYWMWMDLDDSLGDKDAFIKWRDHAMEFADFWLATYNYALDKNGKPVVSFVRERAIKTKLNFKWKYFVHEGVVPDKPCKVQQITTWKINHHRTREDLEKDKGRNLKLYDGKKNLEPRMKFYLGKEQFENGLFPESFVTLLQAASEEKLEMHDRILAMQYCATAAQKINQPERAVQMAHNGLQIAPGRAEFYCIIADCYAQKGEGISALPFYEGARACINSMPSGGVYSGAIFSSDDAYGLYPTIQIIKILASFGKLEEAEIEVDQAIKKWPANDELRFLKEEIIKLKTKMSLNSSEKIQTEDIVFSSTPHPGPYEWDEEIAKTQGMGGSETACIEMAKHLKNLTGRNVIVFNHRASDLVSSSGVQYRSIATLSDYFAKYKPKVHIAWRHNTKLTEAPSYLWCHDLFTPGVEFGLQTDKILCLTPFHADYVQALQGVPKEKIIVTSNGIDPEKFNFKMPNKNPNKMVWLSSPDRGLKECILILDKVKKEFPDVGLHVFYGLENLYKYGLSSLAEELKGMMKERPWIIYHGFTEQKKMAKIIADAVIWPHSCDFIETSCITAMEVLALGIYPVTRKLGGLKDTLKKAEQENMAILLDIDPFSDENKEKYASAIKIALKEKAWERVKINPEDIGWRKVAESWVKFMNL